MLKREWNEIGPAKWKIPFNSTYENFGKSNRKFCSNGARPVFPDNFTKRRQNGSKLGTRDKGRDPFDQNFRKFLYKIKWNRTFLEIRFENCGQPPEVVLKFREIVSEILVKWIAPKFATHLR